MTGKIVILNGPPRSGKSSIAQAMQTKLSGHWINLGVDAQNRCLPVSLLPGIGLRPGGERPDLEPNVLPLLLALYDSVAAHARQGFNVVVDAGHHDDYSQPLDILPHCARRLTSLSVLFVSVHCPIETIMARRNADPQNLYLGGETPPAPVLRWQDAIIGRDISDLSLDTSVLTPEQSALAIAEALQHPAQPTAFERFALG